LGLARGNDGRAAEITFHTRSGALICRTDAGTAGAITMDFPRAEAEPSGPVEGLAEALGAEVVDQGRSFDLVAQLASPAEVAAVQPDLTALAHIDTRAVVITAAGDIDGGPAHFVSRVFGPRVGVPEDPVTGSAHCITGPWWGQRLGLTELEAHQVSARGGRMRVRLAGNRVELTGHAVTVLDGTLLSDL
ncbi:MAG: PhzF family phenazine biosynthesis protein, partial [Acidimicrobiia bacterium]|nr:PhzF family phenazine biosynthesis protein [Acidimicrobiia bacterium]